MSAKEMFEKIEELREEKQEYKTQLEHLDSKLNILILQYRIQSVKEKLSKLRADKLVDKPIDLDSVLVNCLNKLNGNIDGIGDS